MGPRRQMSMVPRVPVVIIASCLLVIASSYCLFGEKRGAAEGHQQSSSRGVAATSLAAKIVGGHGGIGPRWTWDPTMEKPAGVKNMGSWTEAVYTKQQQTRLGVDAQGHKVRPAVHTTT